MNETEALNEIKQVAEQILQSMVSRDFSQIRKIFTEKNSVLMDSFYPYIFSSSHSVEDWASGFSKHSESLTSLDFSIEEPLEFSLHKDTAFLSVPVTWKGESHSVPFLEQGGMALVLLYDGVSWKVQNYAWAATSYKEY